MPRDRPHSLSCLFLAEDDEVLFSRPSFSLSEFRDAVSVED